MHHCPINAPQLPIYLTCRIILVRQVNRVNPEWYNFRLCPLCPFGVTAYSRIIQRCISSPDMYVLYNKNKEHVKSNLASPSVISDRCPVFISVFLPWSALPLYFCASIKHLSCVCHGCYCCSNFITNIKGQKAPLGCILQYPL